MVLPDYFSGVSVNATTAEFSLEGFAGSAVAAIGGSPVLNQPFYCFVRLVDDILGSKGSVKRLSSALHPGFGDLLGFHATSPRRGQSDAVSPCETWGTTSNFPRFPLPEVDWIPDADHESCVVGLFAADNRCGGVPVLIGSSGSLESAAGGLPMRLVLPPNLLANSSVTVPDFFGKGTKLILRELTVDIRKYFSNDVKPITFYEGIIAASVAIDGVSFDIFIALSTLQGSMSACQPAAGASQLLPRWFHPVEYHHEPGTVSTTATQAVRMYLMAVDYHTEVLQLHGTLYGVNGECPSGRTMAARLTMTLLLGATGDSARADVSVDAAYNLCNSTQDAPRWSLRSTVALSNYGLFGAELIVASASVAAKGWTSGNNTAWQVGINGSATNVFGLDSVSVQAVATSIPHAPVDAVAALALNTTLFHDPALHIEGALSYYANQSASGDVVVNLRTSFGTLAGAAEFVKRSPLGAHNDTYLWMVNGSVSNVSLSVLKVRSACSVAVCSSTVSARAYLTVCTCLTHRRWMKHPCHSVLCPECSTQVTVAPQVSTLLSMTFLVRLTQPKRRSKAFRFCPVRQEFDGTARTPLM